MEINFLGHATFELVEGDTRILIDPFLSPNNPAATLTADDVEPTHVLVTHGHQDHLADAAAIGKRTGAKFVALTELAGWLKGQGIEDCVDPNLGGTVAIAGTDGTVKLVQAFHSSTTPDGTVTTAAGMIVSLGGTTVYH